MSIEMNLPVLFQQIPHLEFLTNAEMAHPEASRVLSQEAAMEERLKEREQVQTSDAQDPATAIRRDATDEGGGGAGGRHRDAKPEEEEEAPEPFSDNPWSGNIINRSV